MKCPHCNALVVVNEKGELVEYIPQEKPRNRWEEIGWGVVMLLTLLTVLCVLLRACG